MGEKFHLFSVQKRMLCSFPKKQAVSIRLLTAFLFPKMFTDRIERYSNLFDKYSVNYSIKKNLIYMVHKKISKRGLKRLFFRLLLVILFGGLSSICVWLFIFIRKIDPAKDPNWDFATLVIFIASLAIILFNCLRQMVNYIRRTINYNSIYLTGI